MTRLSLATLVAFWAARRIIKAAVICFMGAKSNNGVSDRSQPPLAFDLSQGESVGSDSLDRHCWAQLEIDLGSLSLYPFERCIRTHIFPWRICGQNPNLADKKQQSA